MLDVPEASNFTFFSRCSKWKMLLIVRRRCVTKGIFSAAYSQTASDCFRCSIQCARKCVTESIYSGPVSDALTLIKARFELQSKAASKPSTWQRIRFYRSPGVLGIWTNAYKNAATVYLWSALLRRI